MTRDPAYKDELTTVGGRIFAMLLGAKAMLSGERSMAADDQLARTSLGAAETFLKERDEILKRPETRPADERPESDHTRDVRIRLEGLNRVDP